MIVEIGARVRHPTRGEGTVLQVDGLDAFVDFGRTGRERGWVPTGDILPLADQRPRMTWAYAGHNLLAHPFLVICPPVGEWLHRRIPES